MPATVKKSTAQVVTVVVVVSKPESRADARVMEVIDSKDSILH